MKEIIEKFDEKGNLIERITREEPEEKEKEYIYIPVYPRYTPIDLPWHVTCTATRAVIDG